jgi:hypothetical protein
MLNLHTGIHEYTNTQAQDFKTSKLPRVQNVMLCTHHQIVDITISTQFYPLSILIDRSC